MDKALKFAGLLLLLCGSAFGQILTQVMQRQPTTAVNPPVVTYAVNASTTTTASTSNTSSYRVPASGDSPNTFAPAVGDLLLVFVTASGTVQNPATMTDSTGEVTFTQYFRQTTTLGATSGASMYVFVGNQAVSSTTGRYLTFDCTGDAATGAVFHIYRISNMQVFGTTALRQYKAAVTQTAGGTPALTFDTAANTLDPVFAFLANAATNATSDSPPSGWTEGDEDYYSTPSTAMETAYVNSGFTGSTVTWGGTSATVFGEIIVELNNAAATPTFSPSSGDPTGGAISVTISSATSGANSYIYHTEDGSTPTSSSTQGTSVSVTTDPTTVKAKVIGLANYADSAVGSASYSSYVTPSIRNATWFNLGNNASPQTVTIPATALHSTLAVVTWVPSSSPAITATASPATLTMRVNPTLYGKLVLSTGYDVAASITTVSLSYTGSSPVAGVVLEIQDAMTAADSYDVAATRGNGYNTTDLGTGSITTTHDGLAIAVLIDGGSPASSLTAGSGWTGTTVTNSNMYEYRTSTSGTGYGSTTGQATGAGSGINFDAVIFNIKGK